MEYLKYFLFPLAAVVAYFIAGVNPAIVLSKAIYHEDIREKGSGNPGFTNFKRVYGGKYAWAVFFLDIAKTIVIVSVFSMLFGTYFGARQAGAAYTGLFSMLGHCFPAMYRFKGGKGFLVCMTTIWFIDYRCGILSVLILVAVLLTVKYMSLASMLSVWSCPVLLFFIGADSTYTYVIMILCCLLLTVRHGENIKRLAHGEESKFSFSSHDKDKKHAV